MKLFGVNQHDIAQRANRSPGIVSQFLLGNKNSRAVRQALTIALAYESFEKLLEAARKDLAYITRGGSK
jgi:hypothetical protein